MIATGPDDDVEEMLPRDGSCDALMRCDDGSRDRRGLPLLTVAKKVRLELL